MLTATSGFFEIWRTNGQQNCRRLPLLALSWTRLAAVERMLLADWLIRNARISGGWVVAEFPTTPRAPSVVPVFEDAA